MDGKPSVLYICFDVIPSPKGAGTHVAYFTRALAERYDVTLISAGNVDAKTGTDLPNVRHIAVPLGQANFLDRALEFQEAVWDELQRNRYDLVHYRTMWAAIPMAEEKASQGFRAVCEVNGVDSIELKYHYPALRGTPSLLEKLRAQEQLAFDTADILLTPSHVTKVYLMRRGQAEDKIEVIPNGADLDLFQPRKPVFLQDGTVNPITLLYTGTLTPWQGLDILLDAIKRVAQCANIRLMILSSGPRRYVKTLEKQVRKLHIEDNVEFLDPVPHEWVSDVINDADICVAPLAPTERNIVQGCSPVKLFEYMACGKAIAASNLPVVREVLTHEEDALLFSVGKSARLAECLLRLVKDDQLRERLGRNAMKTASRFSWRRAQDSLLNIYSRL